MGQTINEIAALESDARAAIERILRHGADVERALTTKLEPPTKSCFPPRRGGDPWRVAPGV